MVHSSLVYCCYSDEIDGVAGKIFQDSKSCGHCKRKRQEENELLLITSIAEKFHRVYGLGS